MCGKRSLLQIEPICYSTAQSSCQELPNNLQQTNACEKSIWGKTSNCGRHLGTARASCLILSHRWSGVKGQTEENEACSSSCFVFFLFLATPWTLIKRPKRFTGHLKSPSLLFQGDVNGELVVKVLSACIYALYAIKRHSCENLKQQAVCVLWHTTSRMRYFPTGD